MYEALCVNMIVDQDKFNFYVYVEPFSHILHLVIGLSREGNTQSRITFHLHKKRRNGERNSQKALRVLSLLQLG